MANVASGTEAQAGQCLGNVSFYRLALPPVYIQSLSMLHAVDLLSKWPGAHHAGDLRSDQSGR